jgi:lipopolysaccharide heptosyltransferase I
MHVLLVKLSAIGDVVHALPAAAALRRGAPDVRITWVVEHAAAAILRGSPAVDRLVEIDTRSWRRRLLGRETRSALVERLSTLRAEPVDVALDMQGLLKSGLVALASGARRRVGFATEALREPASRAFLTEQVAVDDTGHVIEKNLALVRHLGVATAGDYEFPIAVPAEVGRDLEVRLPAEAFAILNPGGGWQTKLWPAERFGALAERLGEQYGLVSLVTYGPGEEELARRVAAASPSGAARPFACTLMEFVALARRSRLFVGGDTGPLHLAAAVGAPVVGIYGPTSPLRNGPFDPRDRTVGRTDLACRTDCYRRTCDHWECLEIPVDAVQRVVDARLQTL